MGILERIKSIEEEMGRTQKNKATMSHLCRLKAQLAKLRSELLAPPKGGGGEGEGFEVTKTGSARIALIGFPSAGKSTLLSTLTGTESEQASYEFTTLTCIPGNIHYKGTRLQLLDLPGIIEGAAHGKGRGRQVIACAKSADLVLMVLDAAKEGEVQNHRAILERELEVVGMRLNKTPADIYYRLKKTGGVKFSFSGCTLTQFGEDPEATVKGILQEYKVHNCDVLFREDASPDELIDMIEGNRKYVRCLYVYNKVDCITLEGLEELVALPHSTVISCSLKLNLDLLLEQIWEYLDLVRVYTKKRGEPPGFGEPVVLTVGRHGKTVESACRQIHRTIVDDFHFANVWGSSTKHNPQRCGLSHVLEDEDVVQIVKKTNQLLKRDKNYNQRVQAHYDAMKLKNKKKGKLKT